MAHDPQCAGCLVQGIARSAALPAASLDPALQRGLIFTLPANGWLSPEVDPAEAAFEILDRIGAKPQVPRFAFIAGLRAEFEPEAVEEAARVAPSARPLDDAVLAVTIDDEDTVEVDDALSCEPLADGSLRVRVHIALVADFVVKGGLVVTSSQTFPADVAIPGERIAAVGHRPQGTRELDARGRYVVPGAT